MALTYTPNMPPLVAPLAWLGTGCAGAWWLYRHFTEKQDAAESAMTWRELESRFKELQAKEIRQSHEKRIAGLVDAVTFQASDGREMWRLMGSNREVDEEAERLIRIAGARLRSAKWEMLPRTEKAANDFDRWLYFVAEFGQHARHLQSSSFERGKERRERRDFWINGIVGESVKGCLECLTRESAITP